VSLAETQRAVGLRRALADGRPLFGLFVKMPCAATIEIAGHEGFDLVVVDMEHGASDMAELEHHLRAADACGLHTLVRVSSAASPDVLRSLDAGAHGVVVPHVSSAAEAERAVAATRYPPRGTRSLAMTTRAARYGRRSIAEHLAESDREVALVAQIESREGLECASEIAATRALDGVLIGPADLSASLGRAEDPHHPDVTQAIERISDAVLREGGPALCVLAASESEARRWVDRGARIVLFVAFSLLGQQLRTVLSAVRAGDSRGERRSR
jgi:4-hydroxy-2-oxoheptanedioate aldolase